MQVEMFSALNVECKVYCKMSELLRGHGELR